MKSFTYRGLEVIAKGSMLFYYPGHNHREGAFIEAVLVQGFRSPIKSAYPFDQNTIVLLLEDGSFWKTGSNNPVKLIPVQVTAAATPPGES